MSWFERAPHRLDSDRAAVAGGPTYAHLTFEIDSEKRQVSLAGTLHLLSRSGIPTPIRIKLLFPDDYPTAVPDVYEIDGVLPRGLDGHVGEDGRLCLSLPQCRAIDMTAEGSIVNLLNQVTCFAHKALIRKWTGTWPGPQEPHGREALLVWHHEEIFGYDDPRGKSALQPALDGDEPPMNQPCPCGSGRKYKRCHCVWVQAIRQDGAAN